MTKHEASIAVITETETTHSYASTTHMEGWKAFCPPESVTGPQNKEAGVIMMVANELASVSKKRPDINGNDSVQTVWTEFTKHNLLVGGVYRRNKPFQPDLEKEEVNQLINQVLKASQTGKAVLLLGDLNLDHLNPNHKKKIEAADLLSAIESANMKHMPTGITWKSDGLFKICDCTINLVSHDPQDDQSKLVSSRVVAPLATLASCGCPKGHRTSTIDNVYISQSENATAVVLEDGISDHFPVLVSLESKVQEKKSKLETIFRRNFLEL